MLLKILVHIIACIIIWKNTICMEDRIGYIILRRHVASSFAFHIKHVALPQIVISQIELICFIEELRVLAKHADFVGEETCTRDAYTPRALYAVMGSWLAGEKVPEESGPLEAAGGQQDCRRTATCASWAGRGPGRLKQRGRAGKGREKQGGTLKQAVHLHLQWFCDSDNSLPNSQSCLFTGYQTF